MASTKTTTKIYLDKRHKCGGNKYTIKLRVTNNRKSRYYSTGMQLTEPAFDKVIFSQKRSVSEKEAFLFLTAFETRATECINAIPYFTFEQFEARFISNRGATDSLEQAFNAYAMQIKQRESISYARSFITTLNSLKRYKTGLRFADITVSFLHGYESHLRSENKSFATIGIYMRNLRVIFNEATENGFVDKVLSPFSGKKHYNIPKSESNKKALPKQEIKSIFNFVAETPNEQFAMDMWIFSYYGNGMNFGDIIRLRNKDIQGDYFRFIREKTKRNTRKEIVVYLNPEMKEIIARYQTTTDGNRFVFPFFTEGMTAEQEQNKKELVLRLINRYLKIIQKKLNISIKLTTYTARHSFATMLKREGARIEYISEMLGHSSPKTTNIYLASFEDDTIKQTSALLDPR